MAILVLSPNGTFTRKLTLEEAAMSLDAAGKTTHVTTPQVVTTAIAWPSDRELVFDNGGYVTFTGVGSLTGLNGAKPEWFGAKGDGITDDYEAIVAADNSTTNRDLVMAGGVYKILSNIVFKNKVVLNGVLTTPNGTSVVFEGGFDAPLIGVLDLSGNVQFKKTEKIYPQWFGASGINKACAVSAAAGSYVLNVGDTKWNNFKAGDTISIVGAGVAGAVMSTTVVSSDTATITILNPVITTITSKGVALRDDTTSLRRFFKSVQSSMNNEFGSTGDYTNGDATSGTQSLYMPRGMYTTFGKVDVFNASNVVGERGNVQGGSIVMQVDISQPSLNLVADNFSITGDSINGGNGNMNFTNLVFKSAVIDDAQVNAPSVNFQAAGNGHSDTLFLGCFWQNTAGYAIAGGLSGAVKDNIGFKMTDCEFDVPRGGVYMTGHVAGDVIIRNMSGFMPVRGLVYVKTDKTFSVSVSDSYTCDAGNHQNVINPEYQHAIYVENTGVAGDAVVSLNNVRFLMGTLGFGGNIVINNVPDVLITGSTLRDMDSATAAKFLQVLNWDHLIIAGCILKSSSVVSYANARMIALAPYAAYSSLSITDTVFDNKSVSPFDNAIESDLVLYNGGVVKDNQYVGLFTTTVHSNVAGARVSVNNITAVEKWATGTPGSGSWLIGDRIINSNPVVGQPKAWRCTVSGDYSGTNPVWVSEGNL